MRDAAKESKKPSVPASPPPLSPTDRSHAVGSKRKAEGGVEVDLETELKQIKKQQADLSKQQSDLNMQREAIERQMAELKAERKREAGEEAVEEAGEKAGDTWRRCSGAAPAARSPARRRGQRPRGQRTT